MNEEEVVVVVEVYGGGGAAVRIGGAARVAGLKFAPRGLNTERAGKTYCSGLQSLLRGQ